MPHPGLTPDSPFYFLEEIIEKISIFFTFNDLKKAEKYINLAAERLAEAKAVLEKGKLELTKETLTRYEEQLGDSIDMAERARDKGKNAEKVMLKVGEATSKHLEVLADVYGKVPEEAKTSIEGAIEASFKGRERAVEVLREQNALRRYSRRNFSARKCSARS